ncbi:hypothetical protein MARLIPOL_08269 [Marinobacter lipolyticus SM19]|uniref:Uncharacterized protein n=1 Tax=Marinobacter lipolyticus SM19 TaxID=1318628 RepID=R8B2B6_9GAMM|nr:hypothetical protein MARLIPOL_08269 [Marinobacter lipolyticus SM19]
MRMSTLTGKGTLGICPSLIILSAFAPFVGRQRSFLLPLFLDGIKEAQLFARGCTKGSFRDALYSEGAQLKDRPGVKI